VRTLRLFVYCSALLAGTVACALAQSPAHSTDTILVMPFENASGAPGLQWISEAFPELLSQRLMSPGIFPLTRDDRLRAYERAGVPAEILPPRATIYRMVDEMDVQYIILGRYTFDGRSFTAAAQILDVPHRKLLPEVHESGALVDLIDVQTAIAWDLLKSLRPSAPLDRQTFVSSAPAIRLDAFEHYVRGIASTATADKIQHFREAVRLNPGYDQAWLRLGKTYFDDHQPDQAIAALSRVSTTARGAREANFYLGVSAYAVGDYPRAESAFRFVSLRLPLPEVYSNLGAVTNRLGNRQQALAYFQKALAADPNNPDYHFNVAVVLAESGSRSEAERELKECLTLSPTDTEARAFLDALLDNSRSAHASQERIKTNFEENSFQQLVLGIQSAAEERLAKTDPASHALFHVGRGQELLTQGFLTEAEKEFREAVALDANNAEAHVGLARALDAENDLSGARAEAETALRLKTFIDPLLLLARLDLRDNKADAAAQSVDRALKLDPKNSSALTLKRAVAAKLAEKAQPLPN
jgi:tetratricopeptide (TPR) repeat protein